MLPNGKARYAALILAVLFFCLIFWDFLFWNGRFPPNCYIEKLDVSGLSKYEALQRLRTSNVDDIVLGPIYLDLEGRRMSFRPTEIGAYISPRRTIINSTGYSYRPNYVVDLIQRVLGTYKKGVVPLALNIDKETFCAVLEGIANSTNVPSRDATFSLIDEKRYSITKERTGKMVDVGTTIRNMEDALGRNERLSTVEVLTLHPRVFAGDIVKYPPKYFLSEYTTYYGSHDSPNRVHNIMVATLRMNNYVIISGETFSLLDKLGKFTSQRGFKEAFVIYNGELEPQYGGGSCQIATTLYNSAVLAGLDIIERHNHGIYFTIYPLGRDASIYSGQSDLKIRNNTFHPVYLQGIATDKRLTFRLYGTPTGRRISFSRPMIFFDGEEKMPYNVMTEEAKTKINEALLNGKPFQTQVKVTVMEAGYMKEKMIISHYKMTGDRENVKIVRPEPE